MDLIQMAAPREQFDALLGGEEDLPFAVNLQRFLNARAEEITALSEAIEEPQNNHLAFQKMPKHLRRRAMSHNVKRMPRRLREVHLSQLEKSGLPVKGRRPSRKYRRRPTHLLQEYNRRQRAFMWLETHIWHAKRCHMSRRWAYALPEQPSNKSFRACYRATSNHCLIQDHSYLICIQIEGSEADILKGLQNLALSETGLTFAAKSTLTGSREGNLMVFKAGSYPFQAIGRVSFMWRPQTKGLKRTIWIWSHPAFYSEFLEEVLSVFGFSLRGSSDMEVDQNVESLDLKQNTYSKTRLKKKNVENTKLVLKNLNSLPKYSNKYIEITLLKDTLNRFHLCGPLSQAVLTEALKFIDIGNLITQSTGANESMEDNSTENNRSAWLSDFYSDDQRLKHLKVQKHFWENILRNVSSADELPPRMILSAVILDPRLSMPTTRTKAVNTSVGDIPLTITEGLSHANALWETDVRNTVTQSKMAAVQLNALRSQALVPGQTMADSLGQASVSHLPIMLVHCPGKQGYGSGWELVAPAGWGMPLWLGLLFRGARVGGLRDKERLVLETQREPTLAPDTLAGQLEAEQCTQYKLNKHFGLPPNKRPNYVKLGVVAPFHCPWRILLRDWFPESGHKGFYVVRNRTQLESLKCLLNKTNHQVPSPFSDRDKACGMVLVGVEMIGRGTLGEGTMICMMRKKDDKFLMNKSGRGPTEAFHKDVNEEARSKARDEHLAKLKKLRKKRIKVSRKLEEEGIYTLKTPKPRPSPTEDIVSKQAEVMRQLWLPSEISSMKNSSSRYVMGFVLKGEFSFTQSRCYGYGYIALSALLCALEKNHTHFLVRNVSSLQYYFVKLKLLS